MPETITRLTGFEAKPGSNANGAYTLHIFTDVEGKKFKTFQDDVADKAKQLVGPEVVLDFEVKQQSRNGRVYTDNFLNGIRDASEVSTETGGGDTAAISPTAQKILAYRAALDTLAALPESFGDSPSFVDICKVADAIYDWASHSAGDLEPEPEPEPEPVTN